MSKFDFSDPENVAREVRSELKAILEREIADYELWQENFKKEHGELWQTSLRFAVVTGHIAARKVIIIKHL